MNGILGPGILLAQFLRDEPPYNDIKTLAPWAALLGYKGLQIPTWDKRVFDLEQAAASQAYCDDYREQLGESGLCVTELCGALQGQVLALHPAYERMFDAFYPSGLSGQRDHGVGDGAAARRHRRRGAVRYQDDSRPFRRVRLADGLSLAAASAGDHRRGIRGAGQALASAAGCGGGRGADLRLRAASGFRPLRRGNVRDVPGARWTIIPPPA